MRDTQIIVPCYNEARRLRAEAFLQFAASQSRISLLFVDDGSRDETWECLKALRQQAPQVIRLLQLRKNQGKAEAVRLGMLDALHEGANYVGFWDADLATPLEAVTQFVDILDRLSHVELVFGTRMPLLGRRIQRSRSRGRLGKLFAWIASNMLGIPLHDTQCGAKLFRSTGKLELALALPFSVRWIFDVELIARLIHLERGKERRIAAKMFEYPLETWTEIPGSKLRWKDFLKAPLELLNIYWRHLGPAKISYPSQAEAALEHNPEIVPFPLGVHTPDDSARRRDAA